MNEAEIKAAAAAYAALPKDQRKIAWSALPDEVRLLAREMVTMQKRGFRHINGRIEFTQEALAEQIVRLKSKHAEMDQRKAKVEEKIVTFQTEYAERFGQLPTDLQ